MSEQAKTTAEVIHAPGEDWLNGRQGACGACGKEDELYWNPLEGHVQCHACGYVNPEATRDTVLYLLEQRAADEEIIKNETHKISRLIADIGRRDTKVEKLEADLKAARAKSKTAKVDDKKE